MKSFGWCWAMTCQLTPLLTLYWRSTARSTVSSWSSAALQLSVWDTLPICSTNMILLEERDVERMVTDCIKDWMSKKTNGCLEYVLLHLARVRSRGLVMACLILQPLKYSESPWAWGESWPHPLPTPPPWIKLQLSWDTEPDSKLSFIELGSSLLDKEQSSPEKDKTCSCLFCCKLHRITES